MEHVRGDVERYRVTGPPKTSEADSKEARQQFRTEMMHFASAYRHELVNESIRVYFAALRDIPVDVRTLALTECLKRYKFFPTVAEVLTACADVVDHMRSAAVQRAKALVGHCDVCDEDHCPDCHGAGLRPGDGPNTLQKCLCLKRTLELMANVAQPIKRPALFAHEPEPAA